MLPKVETESLGLSRSYGEQGLLPRNMQGKNRLSPRRVISRQLIISLVSIIIII